MARQASKSRMGWYKMDAGAFISEITGLSDTHVAIYIKLQTIYWTAGNKLPEIDSALKRRVGAVSTEGEKALDAVLLEFFPEDSTGKRCHAELDSQLSGVEEFSSLQSSRASQPRKKPMVTEESNDDKF